jgi:polar amino acid transport system substrate-binding protein
LKNIFLLSFFVLCFPIITLAGTVTLVSDPWCPYNCHSEDSQPGFIVEISKKVYEKAGHTFIYEVMPWPRAVAKARDGEVNGIIGFTKKDVKGFYCTENEMGVAREVFFVKKNESWKYKNILSLKELDLLGYPNGYHYTPEINEYLEKAENVHPISGDNPIQRMVKMLLRNRISAFIENEMVVNYFLKQSDQTGIISIAGEFSHSKIYVGFGLKSPTHKRDMKILSDGLQTLRRSGELDRILARYGLKDWKE